MKHLFLDSNALIQAGPGSGGLVDLVLCCHTGSVMLHVPELVVLEVASNLVQKVRGVKLRSMRCLADWGRDDEALAAASVLESRWRDERAAMGGVAEQIRSWVTASGGVVAPLTDLDPDFVFREYFKGVGAFNGAKKEKSRIPDAFLYAYVCALREGEYSRDEVLVVTNDGPFAGNLKQVAGVSVFSSVSKLLLDGGIKEWSRVGELVVRDSTRQDFAWRVAKQVALPGEPVFIDAFGPFELTWKWEEAVHECETVYVPFSVTFDDCVVMLDGTHLGEVDVSVPIPAITLTGIARGCWETTNTGQKVMSELEPMDVGTVPPDGFQGC